MSSAATAGRGRDSESDMYSYAQPGYPPQVGEAWPRPSSASKYVPDGYHIPPSAAKAESMACLAPGSYREPPARSGVSFTPLNPEKYRPGPAAFSGAVPPPHLPAYYQQDRHVATDGYDQPQTRHRRASAASHHSDRSRRSSHSHSHRDSDRHRHSADHSRDSEHKKRHYDDDDDQRLKRKHTAQRSYGSSLFALYDSVKYALKGN